MVKFVILGGVAIVLFSAFKLMSGGGIFGGAGKGLKSMQSPASAAAAASTPEQKTSGGAKAAYELRAEKWFARGPDYMKLESGMYQVGKMSKAGFVQAIKDGTVRVAKPDGSFLYLVGEDYSVVTAQVTPSPTPEKREITVAPAPAQSTVEAAKK